MVRIEAWRPGASLASTLLRWCLEVLGSLQPVKYVRVYVIIKYITFGSVVWGVHGAVINTKLRILGLRS